MIFFELIGKVQWYLIGAGVLFGVFYAFNIWREHNSGKGASTSEEFNKKIFTLIVTLVVFAIVVLVLGTLVPSLAQRGADEVGGSLSLGVHQVLSSY